MAWANIFQVRIMGRNHSGQTINVLHFGSEVVANDAPSIAPQLEALANAVIACVRDALLPALPGDWRLEKVTARTVAGFISDEFEVAGAAEDVGELTATDVGFASQLIAVKTSMGGRSRRGRTFLPPPPESAVENSSLSPGQLALLAAFVACLAGKFIGGGATTDFRIGVFSRKLQGASTAINQNSFAAATSLQPKGVVAVMRSRKLGHGS